VVTRNTNTREHLEDSILLAYLRRQQLEDSLSLRISQHIEIERCPRCLHKLDELAQANTILEVLGRMPSYQHYSELSVADTYARVQGAASKRASSKAYLYGTNNRQHPRKSALRLASLPVAFALTIFFTMVIAFALWTGGPRISGLPQEGIRPNRFNSTVVVQNHATSTPNLALTATASANENATSVLTPTDTPVTGPYLEVCSTPNNIIHWRLVICGHNFEAGYKVELLASGKTPTWLSNLSVNKQGDFKVGWVIDNCANLPTTIFAYEKTNAKTILAMLQNIAFRDCPVLTAPVGPPGVYSTNLSR
jgi:hypothetical protein